MTTRYKTEGEKAGVKRRVNAHATRQREAGMLARKIWATDAEAAQLRVVLAVWRDEPTDLDPAQAELAAKLKPK